MFEITIPDKNDSLVEVELDQELFFLHFSWNSVGKYWSLSIENAYNDEAISCLPILPNRYLLDYVRNEHTPLGNFIAIRNDRGDTISRSDFVEGNAEFYYIEANDEL